MSGSPIPRRAQRRSLKLAATCRTQSGLRDDALISDISQYGCCLTTRTFIVRIGTRVFIRPNGLEGLSGVIRWINGNHAGVEFDNPLYEPVVEHLSRVHANAQPVGVSSFGSWGGR
jgi:hypothetical protein